MSVNIQVISHGDGNKPKPGQRCVMHYTGKLQDGKVFDSSYSRNRPFQFQLGIGQVIKGWDEGVAKMSRGEKSILTISPEYGYGTSGIPDVIPPNATLIFEVFLQDFS